MESITDRILDYLKRNRVSTTEVADVLGKSGAVHGLKAINPGHYCTGKIQWIYAYDESNWPIHEQIQDLEEGTVVFVDMFNCGERAAFGELVSKYILLYHQTRAIVVDGNMRDAANLIKENWPIWCKGFTPEGCFNRKPDAPFDPETINARRENLDGAIAVCDDCGVVVIPKEKINEDLLVALHNIENQEDIWFDRLDHYKESTFDIVCLKKYLQDDVYISRRNGVFPQ